MAARAAGNLAAASPATTGRAAAKKAAVVGHKAAVVGLEAATDNCKNVCREVTGEFLRARPRSSEKLSRLRRQETNDERFHFT